jgi:Rrf2 family protein
MRLSSRCYAPRALLELAVNDTGKSAILKEIAQRQQISLGYLRSLFTPLIAAGILRTVRGSKGGISLVKPANEVKLSEVIQLLEGSLASLKCVDNPGLCNRSESCAIRDIWCEMKKAVSSVLESVTLQGLIERQKRNEQPEEVMYYI